MALYKLEKRLTTRQWGEDGGRTGHKPEKERETDPTQSLGSPSSTEKEENADRYNRKFRKG